MISDWCFFALSDKLKFAVKVSLSIMLVYLISFTQGWEQGQTAAITIMLIAVAGPVAESVAKGLRRVAGTVIGAVIGMVLIALFPQERELYLFFLSIFVTITLYLTRAYKGDMTVFMLTAVTMMMVFKNGEVDDVFLYGIDRTFMTVFGIAIFTFIGIFLWPVKAQSGAVDIAGELLSTQSELYRKRDEEKIERKVLYEKLQSQEAALQGSVTNTSAQSEGLSPAQRNTILQNIKQINELLMLLSYHDKADFVESFGDYIKNFDQADEEAKELFGSLKSAIKEQKEIKIPSEWKADYNEEAIRTLSHIERAALTATILDIQNLHAELRALAAKLNAVFSPYPTRFELSKTKTSSFNWFDREDMKGTLISFLIFWTTTIFWVQVNPPAGFLIVTLATALSVLTTFSPLKPSMLIVLFSFSFLFAAVMYILVLPNIHYGWELGLFIFLYAFIGFYFINPKIAIFFLLGMAILGLSNPMVYNFQLFLVILLVFYLFLFVLLIFYYVPFSTKPEVLFLKMKQRFFGLSSDLLQRSNNLLAHNGSFPGRMKAWYAEKHLTNTVKKMQLWVSKIDTKYFDALDQKTVLAFTKECETFAYLLQMLYRREISSVDNALIQDFKEKNTAPKLAEILSRYAQGMETKDLDSTNREGDQIIQRMEEQLTDFFSRLKPDQYSREEIIQFYELLALRRNLWVSFFTCQDFMEKLDLDALERSRF